jgi:hypothetical protein
MAMVMSEQEKQALWQELKAAWCHRTGTAVFNATNFNTFVLARLAADAAANVTN